MKWPEGNLLGFMPLAGCVFTHTGVQDAVSFSRLGVALGSYTSEKLCQPTQQLGCGGKKS